MLHCAGLSGGAVQHRAGLSGAAGGRAAALFRRALLGLRNSAAKDTGAHAEGLLM